MLEVSSQLNQTPEGRQAYEAMKKAIDVGYPKSTCMTSESFRFSEHCVSLGTVIIPKVGNEERDWTYSGDLEKLEKHFKADHGCKYVTFSRVSNDEPVHRTDLGKQVDARGKRTADVLRAYPSQGHPFPSSFLGLREKWLKHCIL